MKACVISAPMTGSGKTTVTIGLLSLLAARGVKVQAFKVGPDFIDPGLHELATGNPSHNLDGWMFSRETNLDLFASATAGKEAAIVEGVMGLFDGSEGGSNSGSTAEMAAWLNLPVILVVDANPLARSVAAVIHGFQTFDPAVQIAGVIFNRVAGESHFRILSDAVKSVPVLGWLPLNPEIEIRERHLGLITAGESEARLRVERIREFCASYLNVDRILEAMSVGAGFTPARPNESSASGREPAPSGARAGIKLAPTRLGHPVTPACVRVALAQDAAFSFYYHANRNALEQAGAKVIEFSPIHDTTLPEADFLYIGGGYPELYRQELEANHSMRNSIRKFIESGKRFYAECGGLMYLARNIDGAEMVGILPTEIQLTDKPVDFGYCDLTTTQPSILGPAGTHVRGHQFHYSKSVIASSDPLYRVRQNNREYKEGWLLPNGIASYVHLHFLSNPVVARNMLES